MHGAWPQHRDALLEGLWGRLSRHARGTEAQRLFIIGELTHVLSCPLTTETGGKNGREQNYGGR